MKKIALTLALPLVLAGSSMLTSCQEKAKTTKKETVAVSDTTKTVTKTVEEPVETDTAKASTETSEKPVSASAQKFGHINSADLIKLMPETKKAEASLAAYVKTLEGQLGGLQRDYQKKVSEYQAQEKGMVDAVKATKIQAIQNLEQQMQESQAMGQQKIAQKRESLFKPILDKAEKAVKDVAKENDYDYVFDTNSGGFIYSKDSHDVMPLVKAKLGIK